MNIKYIYKDVEDKSANYKIINNTLLAFNFKQYHKAALELYGVFRWSTTIQGENFWFGVVRNLQNNVINADVEHAMHILQLVVNAPTKELTKEDVI